MHDLQVLEGGLQLDPRIGHYTENIVTMKPKGIWRAEEEQRCAFSANRLSFTLADVHAMVYSVGRTEVLCLARTSQIFVTDWGRMGVRVKEAMPFTRHFDNESKN
jgi:hypothetical protein